MLSERLVLFKGGRAYAVNLSVEADVPIEKMIAELANFTISGYDILPHADGGCAVSARVRRYGFYLIYQASGRRQAIYRSQAGVLKPYFIVVPHTYVGILMNNSAVVNAWIWFSQEKIKSTESQLHRVCLPNVYRDGRICLGDLSWDVKTVMQENVLSVAGAFWTSNFTNHVNEHWDAIPAELAPPGIGKTRDMDVLNESLFGAWQKMSEDDPKKIPALPWLKSGSVSQVIEAAIGRQMRELG